MKVMGQGIGILALVITGLFVFLILNASVMGIFRGVAGARSWWPVSRFLTRHESPVRAFLIRLFSYERWADEIVGRDGSTALGTITVRAIGVAGSKDRGAG